MAVVAQVVLIDISVGKRGFDRIMRRIGTFVVIEFVVVRDVGMLILAQEYTVAGIGKIVVLHQVCVGDDHQQGGAITGIGKGTVYMGTVILVDMTVIGPEHTDAVRGVPGEIVVVDQIGRAHV